MRRKRREGPNKFLDQDLFTLLTREPPDYGEDYGLFEEALLEKQRQFVREHPLGLTQAELSFALDTAEDDNFLLHCAGKISQAAPELLESFGFEEMKASAHQVADGSLVWDLEALAKDFPSTSQRCNLWELQKIFSFQEIARLYNERQIGGRLSDQIYSHPYQTYVAKLALSTWHWYTPYDEGVHQVTWKRVMDFHKFFTGFDFGLPGFEVTIDHSVSWMNTKGPSTYADSARFTQMPVGKEVWLDGEIALLVSVKGEHVLTIGVSPTNAGLLVNQIQLRKEKGNRWLYKLGKSYFEYVLERLYLACTEANLDLFFVTGESLLPCLKALHTEKNPWAGDDERLMRLYNQPLPGFERGSEEIHVNGLEYFRLTLVEELSLAMVA